MVAVTGRATGAAGLGTRGARATMATVWLLAVAWGLGTRGLAAVSVVDVAAYLCLLLGGIVLTSPTDEPLRPPQVALVAVCSVLTFGLTLLGQAPSGDSFLANLGAYLSALLIVRGNPVLGGIGATAIILAGVWWAESTGAPPATAVDLLAIPVVAFVVGFLWRRLLTGIVRMVGVHNDEAARSALRAEALAEAAETNRREIAEVRRRVAPLLQRMARGEPLDAAGRVDLRVTEGAIRDWLRAPDLQDPALAAAIADLRRTGVHVLVLGADDEPLEPVLADALTAVVANAEGSRVTIRAIPSGRRARASVVVEDGDRVERTMIDADGRIINRQ